MASIVRFRRYRSLLLFAVVAIVVFIHFSSFKDSSATFSVDRIKPGWDTGSGRQRSQQPVEGKKTRPPTETHLDVPPTQKPSPKRPSPETTTPAAGPALPTSAAEPALPTSKAGTGPVKHSHSVDETPPGSEADGDRWVRFSQHYPVPTESIIPLPTPHPEKIPRIQASFGSESEAKQKIRHERLAAVKDALQHSWTGYRTYAWRHDELMPVSKYYKDPFGGWGATLVDSLDTLWIMGMEHEFMEALQEVAKIDFTTTSVPEIPVFETVIRYLGGLIGAYDVSGGKHEILLQKAIELGDVIYGAFDTPNRMPVLHWGFRPRQTEQHVRADIRSVSAELGSLSVEFTRLAQITGNNTYYDAVQRIGDALEESQNESNLPGMWPMIIDASGCKVVKPAPRPEAIQSPAPPPGRDLAVTTPNASKGNRVKREKRTEEKVEPLRNGGSEAVGNEIPKSATRTRLPASEQTVTCLPQGLVKPPYQRDEKFTLGGMADSLYEYLIKEYLLLGGSSQYKKMYEAAIDAAKKSLFFRPFTHGNPDILLTGSVFLSKGSKPRFDSNTGHLACFAGGMLALGAKALNREEDLQLAAKLTDGCVWAYSSFPSGIMPEYFQVARCNETTECDFSVQIYHEMLVPGYTRTPPLRSHQHAKRGVIPPLSLEEVAHGLIESEGLPSGFVWINDRRYILRPEAIESVFIMYRITGDSKWQDKGWKMFSSIIDATRTEAAFSAIEDVTKVRGDPRFKQLDSQESFFNAETLKYFYLLFSDPDVISLDDYVLNTEAHPLLRPKKSA